MLDTGRVTTLFNALDILLILLTGESSIVMLRVYSN